LKKEKNWLIKKDNPNYQENVIIFAETYLQEPTNAVYPVNKVFLRIFEENVGLYAFIKQTCFFFTL